MLTFAISGLWACGGRMALPDEEPAPSPAFQELFTGYKALAAALELTAVSCWVGTHEAPDTPSLYYGERIVDEWMALLVSSPERSRWIEREDHKMLFAVTWSSAVPGGTAPCALFDYGTATLRVEPRDQNGTLIRDAVITGGGGDPGHWEGEQFVIPNILVRPLSPQALFAKCNDERILTCTGRLRVEPLSDGEVRDVIIPITYPSSLEDYQQAAILDIELTELIFPEWSEEYPSLKEELSTAQQELVRLQQIDLNALPPAGRALVETELTNCIGRISRLEAEVVLQGKKHEILEQIITAYEAGNHALAEELREQLRAIGADETP